MSFKRVGDGNLLPDLIGTFHKLADHRVLVFLSDA